RQLQPAVAAAPAGPRVPRGPAAGRWAGTPAAPAGARSGLRRGAPSLTRRPAPAHFAGMPESAPERVLVARFDPKLRVYLYLRSLGFLLITMVGISVIPVWLLIGW